MNRRTFSTQAIPAKSENIPQCQFRNEDGSKLPSYEAMVTPVESFQDSSGLRVAQTVVRDNEGNRWVRLQNFHNEDMVTYKNSRVEILETIEVEHQTISVQTESTEDAKDKNANWRSTSELMAGTCFLQN